MRKYDVYGGVCGLTGQSGSKHKWVGSLGHPSEDETGLVYMRARYYDPAVGRFVSEDPAKDGGNWFGYASASPVNNVDADGRITLLAAAGVAALCGLVAAITNCLLDGWTLQNFAQGFLAGAITGFAGLFGAGAGAVAGALTNLAMCAISSGGKASAERMLLAFACGFAFGGWGGAIGPTGLAGKAVLSVLVYTVMIGVAGADVEAYANELWLQ